MINLTISGRVGKDAKELENGCVFSIASTKKGFTTKDGKVIEDRTIWFDVFAHKNLAQYIKKGDSLTIYTDFINTSVYEDNVGLTVNAVSIEFGGKSNQNNTRDDNVTSPQVGVNDEMPF